jgi:hypothetical protein
MIVERDAAGRVSRSAGRAKGSKNKRPTILGMLPPDALSTVRIR